MTGKMENLISEIIRKECERYRLVEWGLLSSVEEETDILCSLLSLPADETWEDRERFKQWRKELLTFLFKDGLCGFSSETKRYGTVSTFSVFYEKADG